MPFVDIYGSIVANTLYDDGTLVAKDVEMTLPEVTPVIAEIEANGTMSVPMWNRLENMELTVSKVGVDKGFSKMATPDQRMLEARFVQNVTGANGVTKPVGGKAFMTCVPVVIPGIGLAVGEGSTNEMRYTVTRYQLFVNGEEICLIDRIAGITKINGKDYAKATNDLL